MSFSSISRSTTPILEGEEVSHRQVYKTDSRIDSKLSEIVNRAGPMDVSESAIYADPEDYIEERRDDIYDHLDRSIQLFFLTAICCYKTDYHFEWDGANDQYGKGRTVEIETHDGDEIEFKTHGAHSSVLPCLLAYSRKKWEKFQEAKKQPGNLPVNKPNGHVYLKHSHYYTKNNGTIELEISINQADCRRDGTHVDQMLRERAIEIINAVAKGKYGPKKATRKFKKVYIATLKEAMAKLDDDDLQKKVHKVYKKRLKNINLKDGAIFDQMLGADLKDKKEKQLRKIVYKPLYTLIRKSQEVESKIARIILDGQNKILNQNKDSLSTVNNKMRYALLKSMKGLDRKRVEKLLCTSIKQLRDDANPQGLKVLVNFSERKKTEVGKLAEKIRKKFRELVRVEFEYRAKVFKGLREREKTPEGKIIMTQEVFAQKFNEKYEEKTKLTMSQPKVSCFEQPARGDKKDWDYSTPIEKRRTWIKLHMAKRFAKILGVQPGFFKPGTVASIY